ncbi:hypothetical protein [Pseudomonas sp. 25 E 4]|nr:hypothetical protein [Pseudomonas sp. 25 E 4]
MSGAGSPPAPGCPGCVPRLRRHTPPAAHRSRPAGPAQPLHAPAARLAGRPRFRPSRSGNRESSLDGRCAPRTPAHRPRCNGPSRRCGRAAHRGHWKTGPAGSVRRSAPDAGNSPGQGQRVHRCTTRRRRRWRATRNRCRARITHDPQLHGQSARQTRRRRRSTGSHARWTPPWPRSARRC